MSWHSKRGAHFYSTPLSLARCFGPGNEMYSSCVRGVVLYVLTADAHNLAKPTATGAEWLQCQDTTQEIGDLLGTCVRNSTTHNAEPGVGRQTPPEIGTFIVTNVGRDTAWSSIGIASSRMTVFGRNWVMSITVPRYQRAIDACKP
jgi:hypothetical protein